MRCNLFKSYSSFLSSRFHFSFSFYNYELFFKQTSIVKQKLEATDNNFALWHILSGTKALPVEFTSYYI